MSNRLQNNQYQDNLLTPKNTSLRQGDQTRRMMFNQGQQSIGNFQKKGDETFPLSQIGQDDRWLMDFDSINQTNNPLKANNNFSILNKSIPNRQRLSLVNVDRLNQLETQGLISPKGYTSPKETLRSYSNIIMSISQQNSVSELGYRNGVNKFRKSKTTNIFQLPLSKEEQLEQLPKISLRKSKTQKYIDDSKTENIQQSGSREDIDIQIQLGPQETKSREISNQIVANENGMTTQWKKSGLLIITAVRKFVLKMQNLSLIRRYNNITLEQFKVINDKSAYYDPHMRGKIYKQRGYFKNLLIKLKQNIQKNIVFQKIEFLSTKISVFEPDQVYIIIWMIIMLCSILLLLISNPMFVAFQEEQNKFTYYYTKQNILLIICFLFQKLIPKKFIKRMQTYLQLIWFQNDFESLKNNQISTNVAFCKTNRLKKEGYISSPIILFCMRRLPLFIMLADITVRLNTAYYKRGIVVQLRWNIARHYIKHRMWLDLTIVFLFIIYDIQNINILMIITLLLIKKMTQSKKELEDAVALDKKKQAIYQLLKLCLFVIIIAHFCGCIFWSVGKYSQNYEKSWIEQEKLEYKTFYEKYVSSLYWATVTMLTVGYGDIVPANEIEKQIVILIMIFSCGIYAYSLNQIGVLIEEITYEDKEFKQIYSQLSLYMKRRNLDVKIQAEVRRYYQYLHWEKHNYSQNGEEMLNPLKNSLRQKVILNINYQLLEKNKMFLLEFSKQFLEQLALIMKEKEYMPDDKVWQSTDLKQNINWMFFVIRGQIQQKVNDQFTVKVFEEGSYFNEKSFIIDEAPNITYSSTCISTLVYLDKQEFLEVIRNFPNDYEIYCKLRDQSKNQGFLSVLDSRCETCELFTHQFNNCPQVNSIINKEKIIYNINHSSPHLERTHMIRKQMEELNQSNVSDRVVYDKNDHLYHKRYNALLYRRDLLENIVDFLIDRNPLRLDEDNLIEYMKIIVEYNDNPDDVPSPDLLKFGQNIPSQLAGNNERRRSLLIHPLQFFGSRFQEEGISPTKQQIYKKDELFQREQSGQDSRQGSNQYYQQYSKTSTKGNQASVGGIPQSTQIHSNLQSNNTPIGSRESGQYSKRYNSQSHPSKTTSQTEIPSNENLKDLPNDTDIRHLEKNRIEADYGRRRVSTAQQKVTNSLTYNGNQSSYHSHHQMAQSSGAASSYSAPPLELNNSDLSIEDQILYDNMLLHSNEQDDFNVSEALKNLQNKRNQKRKNANQNINGINNNNSTFTILEEETQENQTNFQRTLLANTNIEQDNYNDNYEESGLQQTDLYPKIKEETQQILSAKLILENTDRVNTSMNQNNQNSILPNAYNSLQNPGSINTPGNNANAGKRNSISIKLQNYIRSSSNNTPVSPLNKILNNKGYLVANNSRGEEGFYLQRMGSVLANSKGGSQYGQHQDDMLLSKMNSIRPRKKTESSLKQQHSFQKQLNRIKEEATPKNNLKPKVGSHNCIPSLQNLYGNFIEEQEILFISPKTHDFSDVPDLDKYKIYKDYFPYNNVDKIMKQITIKYIEQEQKRIKKKSQSKMSKLEKIMLKFNSKRTTSRNKTARQSVSPLRQKNKRKTNIQSGIPVIKSVFHQQHSMKNVQ